MRRLSTTRAVVTSWALLGAVTASLVAVASPAHAAPAPTLSKSTVQRGESFTVSGSACLGPHPWIPSQAIVGGGAFAGAVTAGPDGSWSISVDVGGHLGPGTFSIRSSCSHFESGGFDYPTASITVIGDPLPPKPIHTPYMGPPLSGPPAAQPVPPQRPPRTPSRSAAPAPAPAATPSATPPSSSAAASTSTTPRPAPAAGCTDCARLTGNEPVTAGRELTLTYAGFHPGEQVALVLRSTPVELGAFTADAAGIVTATFDLPASAEAGSHTLTFSGPVTGDHVVRFRLAAAQEDRPAAGTSPDDGASLTPPALGGTALLLLGAGGVLLYRRRGAQARTTSSVERAGTAAEEPKAPVSEPIG